MSLGLVSFLICLMLIVRGHRKQLRNIELFYLPVADSSLLGSFWSNSLTLSLVVSLPFACTMLVLGNVYQLSWTMCSLLLLAVSMLGPSMESTRVLYRRYLPLPTGILVLLICFSYVIIGVLLAYCVQAIGSQSFELPRIDALRWLPALGWWLLPLDDIAHGRWPAMQGALLGMIVIASTCWLYRHGYHLHEVDPDRRQQANYLLAEHASLLDRPLIANQAMTPHLAKAAIRWSLVTRFGLVMLILSTLLLAFLTWERSWAGLSRFGIFPLMLFTMMLILPPSTPSKWSASWQTDRNYLKQFLPFDEKADRIARLRLHCQQFLPRYFVLLPLAFLWSWLGLRIEIVWAILLASFVSSMTLFWLVELNYLLPRPNHFGSLFWTLVVMTCFVGNVILMGMELMLIASRPFDSLSLAPLTMLVAWLTPRLAIWLRDHQQIDLME